MSTTPKALFPILILLTATSFTLALMLGSYPLSFQALWQSLWSNGDQVAQAVVWELRAPRAYMAFVCGGLLALAGALMQVLLRNPLADPYILGVSGGAAVAALLAMSLGLGGLMVSTSAFAGSLLSIVLVFGLATASGDWSPTRLLLTGVVIAAGWGAVINLLLTFSADKPLRGMLFWLMGDISLVSPGWSELILLAFALLMGILLARPLNILARGELQAAALGVNVRVLRVGLFLTASLLTAFSVTQIGSVGFVGLVVPHMVRLIAGSNHRVLLPASVLLGGCLLLLADTLARTLLAPQQLPVGVVTAFIGVPFFLFLLNRQYAGRSQQ